MTNNYDAEDEAARAQHAARKAFKAEEAIKSDFRLIRELAARFELLNEKISEGKLSILTLADQHQSADDKARMLKAQVTQARSVLWADMTRTTPRDATPVAERHEAISKLSQTLPQLEMTAREIKTKLGRARQALHFDTVRRDKALGEVAGLVRKYQSAEEGTSAHEVLTLAMRISEFESTNDV